MPCVYYYYIMFQLYQRYGFRTIRFIFTLSCYNNNILKVSPLKQENVFENNHTKGKNILIKLLNRCSRMQNIYKEHDIV